jgi:hypothetical protein
MADRGRTKSKRSAAPWIVLALLGLAVFAGVKTGWVGYGWAHGKAKLFPRDEALLEWIPADAPAVAVIDPHQLSLNTLASMSSVLRGAFDRTRNDVKKLAGVDLAFDVDKAAVTPSLVVLRGRFDPDALATKLAEDRYVKAEYNGRTYLVRAGEDAVMVPSDDLLFYGDEAGIRGAIDAKGGASLAKNDRVLARLDRMGWDHPLLGTLQLNDDRPSLRAVLTGATGPRAVSFGVRQARSPATGFDARVSVEAASPNAASELAKLIEEKRAAGADALKAFAGSDLGTLLAQDAAGATIKADTTAGAVDIDGRLSGEAIDALVRAAQKSEPLIQIYKTVRLYQLLAP